MPIKLPSFRQRRDTYPPDLWTQCPSCQEMLFNKQLEKALRVCSNCGHHFRLSAAARLELLLDPDTFEERDPGLQSLDPLGFVDLKAYPDRVAAAQATTGLRDAAVWGFGAIGGRPVAICVMDFSFMGGSMGSVVGEKVARLGRGGPRPPDPAGHRVGLGRRPDAGRHPVADAAGQDGRRDRAAAPGRRAPDLGDERPDHGRRLRLVRGARRREPGRAERPDRLRRRAGQRRHDPGRAARRASSAPSSCSSTASSIAGHPSLGAAR